MADLHYSVAERQCSARCPRIVNNEEIDEKRMAELLKAHGNEPSFFKLDAEGNDTDPDDLEPSESAAHTTAAEVEIRNLDPTVTSEEGATR